MGNISKFVFPMRNIKHKLVFAHQHLFTRPTLLHPCSYASSFYFADAIGNIFHLLKSDLFPKAAPDIDEQLLLVKLSKLSLPSSEAVQNITLLSRIDHERKAPSAADLVIHCAFAKTMWKARCIAYYTNVVPNPLLIIQLFKKLLRSATIQSISNERRKKYAIEYF